MPLKTKKDEVYEWIKKNVKKPMTLLDISRESGISYHTVIRWTSVLAAEGKITLEKIGTVNVVFPVKKSKR